MAPFTQVATGWSQPSRRFFPPIVRSDTRRKSLPVARAGTTMVRMTNHFLLACKRAAAQKLRNEPKAAYTGVPQAADGVSPFLNYETNPRPSIRVLPQTTKLFPMTIMERVLVPFFLPPRSHIARIGTRRFLPTARVPHVAAAFVTPVSVNPNIARPRRHAIRLNLQRRRRHRSIIGHSHASTTSERNNRERQRQQP
jgi:hypothetical protein